MGKVTGVKVKSTRPDIKVRYTHGSKARVGSRLWIVLVIAAVGIGIALQSGKVSTPGDLPQTPAAEITEQLQTAAADQTVPRLIIPKIGLSAYVENVGLTNEGNMDTPKDVDNTGWYKNGPKPGDAGNAVIDGHLNRSAGNQIGIFWYLRDLAAGDEIYVINADRQKLKFSVTEVVEYSVKDAPLDKIFGSTDKAHLNLITCQGKWDKANETYDKRLVVYSDFVGKED